MRKFNIFFLKAGLLLLMLFSSLVQAGVVIGGTRFIYAQKSQGLSVSVFNRSDESWLVNTKVTRGGSWPGADTPSAVEAPFIATPPLFLLNGGRDNKIRIIRAGGDMPQDRESLFTLSIAAIPSGKAAPNSLQMAIRSGMKLFYRPEGLKGNPEKAYTQLKWSHKGQQLTVMNPTPYFVTLFQLNVNGHSLDDAGMVAPFSLRSENWCGDESNCQLRWQSINDYGRVMPPVSLTLNGNTAVSVAVQAK